METPVESRAETIIWGIRNLPVSLEDKMAVFGMLAAADAWMGDEDKGTVAEAVAQQASNIIR